MADAPNTDEAPNPDDAPVEEQVTYDLDDSGVATVTINRPDIHNALTDPMLHHLGDLFERASGDLRVRCVVLTGAGDRHFCAGQHLAGGEGAGSTGPTRAPEPAVGTTARALRRGWQRLVSTILDCEKPVIARVNGTAAGRGAQLVLASDLAVMAEGARFVEVFVRRGLIPDSGGAYLLPRAVGMKRAKEIMFFGDAVSADRAVEFGIVNRSVPPVQLDAAVAEWTQRFTGLPTRSIAHVKSLLNRSYETDRGEAFEDEAVLQELSTATDDAREGARSLVERREPDFKGR